MSSPRRCITSPARRTSASRGNTSARPTRATSSRRITCSTPCAGSITARACCVTCSAHVYAPQSRPIREDDALRPASPYATSKLAQEMLAAHAWREDGFPAIVARSFNHIGPGQDPSLSRPASRGRSRSSKPDGRSRCSTLGNLEPEARSDRRARHRARLRGDDGARAPASRYNVCSGRALADRRAGRTRSCAVAQPRYQRRRRIRRCFGRTIHRCSSAITAGSPPTRAGHRRFRSSRPSTTSWTTGGLASNTEA